MSFSVGATEPLLIEGWGGVDDHMTDSIIRLFFSVLMDAVF